MLGKIKELMEAQKKLQDMKRDLESLVMTQETAGGKISVTMNGTQRVLSVNIDDSLLVPANRARLQDDLAACVNGASEKVQREAAAKFKSSMGDMKIPGL